TRVDPPDDEVSVLRTSRAAAPRTSPGADATLPWNHRRAALQTDGEHGVGFEVRLRTSARNIVEPAVQAARVNTVFGTVASIEDRTIHCELRAGERSIMVALLPELFPSLPVFGQAFSLEMIEGSDGFQQPNITFREATSV